MNLRGRKVLVTGAGGFIGSHLVEALVGEGASVRAFVHYNSRNDPGMLSHLPGEVFDEIEVVAGDLRDQSAVNEVVNGCELVFHLGALISIPYSYRNPYEVAETNMMGTLNVLQACRNHDIGRLIHTSSSEVYGTAQKVPIDEDHPLQGQSPYSASKIGADKLAESFNRAYELPVVTLRPFNTYGPRQSDRAVIPTIITQALTQGKIELGNLDAKRDFTFISDTVDGFIKASSQEGIDGEVFNIGSGEEIGIGSLAEKVVQMLEAEVIIQVDPSRLRPERSEVGLLEADSSKAQKAFGWKPEITLDDGLELTIEWIREHLDEYQSGTYRF
ncbi:MAG: SDR family NAD(P)-dependent oxidoreductase [Chloroflexi bacterium]|nr:SDR family NAD(P)-dependent oxidoreductase [Chloroflexota bacterium]